MGKYMRKDKGGGGGGVNQKAAVVEVNQRMTGVRTRARALALERSRSNKSVSSVGNLQLPREKGGYKEEGGAKVEKEAAYLELRSRKLQKPPQIMTAAAAGSEQSKMVREKAVSSSPFAVSDENSSQGFRSAFSAPLAPPSVRGPLRQLDSFKDSAASRSNSASVPLKPPPHPIIIASSSRTGTVTRNQRRKEKKKKVATSLNEEIGNYGSNNTYNCNNDNMEMEMDDSESAQVGFWQDDDVAGPSLAHNIYMEVEVSFGENPMEQDGFSPRDSQKSRMIREGTPSSYIRDSEAPGSATRPSSQGRRQERSSRALPPPPGLVPDALSHEIEDFLAGAEQVEHRRFTERYNFDPVRDRPLPGRFEWIRLHP